MEFFLNNPSLTKIKIGDYLLVMVFWNFFLIAVSFFLFFLFKKIRDKTKFKNLSAKILGSFVFFLWFIFIPNTAYIMTDIRHLLDYCPRDSRLDICASNAWMIMFFFIYSIFGWISFVIFLNLMKELIAKMFNKKKAEIFILIIMPFISLGVLLGLINRFNSWDVFTSPLLIFENMLMYFKSFYYLRNFLVFTGSFYILYYLGNILFRSDLIKLNKNKKIGIYLKNLALFKNKVYGLFKDRKSN